MRGRFDQRFLKKISVPQLVASAERQNWRFPKIFSLQYPLEGFAGFERKILKFSSLSTPPCQKPVRWSAFSRTFSPTTYWREMGCLAKKIWNFFSPVPPLIVQAVLNERFSYFLPSVPTGQKSPFGLRNRKLFSFTTQRTWDAEVVRFSGNFFLPIPNGHMEPFWTKENKKSPRKISKGSRFLHIFVI